MFSSAHPSHSPRAKVCHETSQKILRISVGLTPEIGKPSPIFPAETLTDVPIRAAGARSRKRSLWATCLLLFLLVGLSAVSASDVMFSNGTYTIKGNEVTMTMENIQNNSGNTTGTLRMELWALSSPYAGANSSVSGGYRLGVSQNLGALGPYAAASQSSVTTLSYFSPLPKGTYYLTLFISEYEGDANDDGFDFDGYMNFSQPETYGSASGSYFGVSSAAFVGSGYYYDADLGYIYPFYGSGWMYLYDLNRYFYVDLGTDFTTGTYIYDLSKSSWTYTEQSFWPYVYYFDGTGWVDTGFN